MPPPPPPLPLLPPALPPPALPPPPHTSDDFNLTLAIGLLCVAVTVPLLLLVGLLLAYPPSAGHRVYEQRPYRPSARLACLRFRQLSKPFYRWSFVQGRRFTDEVGRRGSNPRQGVLRLLLIVGRYSHGLRHCC
jgi:hypothetical protein